MLGYDMTIYRHDEHGERYWIARWSADWSGLRWIDELVKQGRATLVENAGGYPFRYEIIASEILPLFSPTRRDDLGKALHRKPLFAPTRPDDLDNALHHEPYSDGWNQEPYPWNGYLHEEEISACPDSEVLTVVAWDQS